jgi:hypothetical protein
LLREIHALPRLLYALARLLRSLAKQIVHDLGFGWLFVGHPMCQILKATSTTSIVSIVAM